jgi:hypothetical protein
MTEARSIGSLKLKAEIFHGAETAMGADKASLLEAIDAKARSRPPAGAWG